MRPVKLHVLVFLVGIIVGSATVLVGQYVYESHERDQAVSRWERLRESTEEAFHVRTASPVLVPLNVDFSTNAWQQLAFWKSYARFCSLTPTNAVWITQWRGTPGYSVDDPNWVEYKDSFQGTVLAAEVLNKLANGMSHESTLAWLSTNYHLYYAPNTPTLSKGAPLDTGQ